MEVSHKTYWYDLSHYSGTNHKQIYSIYFNIKHFYSLTTNTYTVLFILFLPHEKINNTRTKKCSPKPSSFSPYQSEFRTENRIEEVCNSFPFLERTEFRIFYPHSKTPFTL
jgi:hypothetical protein